MTRIDSAQTSDTQGAARRLEQDPVRSLSQGATRADAAKAAEASPSQDRAQDRVTLSLAAKSAAVASTGGDQLDDAAATTQSVSLRQLLNTQTLSADARQNQSILSLLR